jgi:hypothetical protein
VVGIGRTPVAGDGRGGEGTRLIRVVCYFCNSRGYTADGRRRGARHGTIAADGNKCDPGEGT